MANLSRQLNNRPRFHAIACGGWILCLIFLLQACVQESRQPLRIATNHWTGYKAFYLASEQGHLSADKFQFFKLPNTTGVLNAFRNGSVNVAAITLDEALLLKSQGFDIHIVAILDISNGADVIMAAPGIASAADMKGKRVGMESGAVGAFLLSRMLEKAGLTIGDIEVVPLTPDQHVEAYKTREVDAVVSYAPVSQQLKALGANTIFDSSLIPHEIIDVLIVDAHVYQQQKAAINTLIKGWLAGVNHIGQKPEESYRRLANMSEVSLEGAREIISRIEFADIGSNRRMLTGSTPELLAPARAMQAVMLQNHLLVKPVKVETLIPEDVEAVLP